MPTTTNTDNTTPTPNHPDLTQLSGATAAVWAALNNQPGTTSTTLAQAAGAGQSTTTKALRYFEQTGLASRESAAPDGSGRPVNYWYPTPTPDPDTSTAPDTTDEPPNADNDSHEQEHHDHPAPTAESPAPEDDTSEHDDADEDEQRGSASEPSQGVESDDAPAPVSEPPTREAASGHTRTEEPQPTVNQSGHRTRLAPGALRQMVIGHLTAHPNEAFTATRISRIIEKSSGAIANALVTLTKQGITEQVTERPRTYRITAAATRSGQA
ncbi:MULTISPECIES: hypothetical protein [Streptomyces]|uniref:MarR family transcriptional regulator n=1 Tax=Streptomyces mordarskii TaxID=1226758 RepID=A0ABN1CQA4_9ACTN